MFEAPHKLRVIEIPEPDPGPGEVLVAPCYVGLCGTDLELLEGSMPYFTQGEARYPLQPGHEWSGVVVRSSIASLPEGTRVIGDPVFGCGTCEACRVGMATRCPDRLEMGVRRGMPGGAAETVAVPAANLHPVPDGVSLRDAVLSEPAVTVLNGLSRVEPTRGRRCLVIGAGTLGLIAAQLLVAHGAEVSVAVREPERRPLVEQLGATSLEAREEAVSPAFEVVVEAAGSAAALRMGVAALAAGGRMAMLGLVPGLVDGFDAAAVVLKDATLYGIINGPGLYDRALAEIAAGTIGPSELIDQTLPLDQAEAAFERLADQSRQRPKLLLEIRNAP